MPRPGTRFAGIAAGCLAAGLLGGCSLLEQPPAVPPTPTPTGYQGPTPRPAWVENLTFGGDLSGVMNQVTAGAGGLRTVCTGKRGLGLSTDTWVLTLFGPIGKQVYGLEISLSDYRGPGTYSAPQATMQVFRPDVTLGWQALGGDAVSFVIDQGEESGTVQATLTNLTNNRSKVRVSGRWTCQT
jgi:hypothetical protein